MTEVRTKHGRACTTRCYCQVLLPEQALYEWSLHHLNANGRFILEGVEAKPENNDGTGKKLSTIKSALAMEAAQRVFRM